MHRYQTDSHWILRVLERSDAISGIDYAAKLSNETEDDGAAWCALMRYARDNGERMVFGVFIILSPRSYVTQLAERALEESIAAHEPDAHCLSTLALQFEDSDTPRAHQLYQRSLQLSPNDPELLTNYAVFLDIAGCVILSLLTSLF